MLTRFLFACNSFKRIKKEVKNKPSFFLNFIAIFITSFLASYSFHFMKSYLFLLLEKLKCFRGSFPIFILKSLSLEKLRKHLPNPS